MTVATNDINDALSPSELDNPNRGFSESTTHSGETSPTRLENDVQDAGLSSQKKKRKKKPKKSAKAKEAAALKAKAQDVPGPDTRPPALCISRNKHWRYISSYHVRAINKNEYVELIYY
jgi:hypothetical protein